MLYKEVKILMAAQGRGWHGDPQGHAKAGRKGGQSSGGNFKRDRDRAREAGRIGGSR